MKIYLADVDGRMIDSWEKVVRYYGELPVETYRGSILDLAVDAVVSPANSFGFMNGGIDLVYSKAFGWDVEKELRRKIGKFFGGELLVGEAVEVSMIQPDDSYRYVVAAPTMRTPSILPLGTINPYLATRAAIRCALASQCKSIAFPGMGTGCGMVPHVIAAWQMANAISEHLYGGAPKFETWRTASAHHAYLGRDPSFAGERRYWVDVE